MKQKYDVVVAGGGAAGMAAAIGARKAGAEVLLVERNGSFGGQATNSNVGCYCGFYTHGQNVRQIVKGVGEEILDELKVLGSYSYRLSPTGNSIIGFDEEDLKFAFDTLAERYDLDYLLSCRVTGTRLSADHKRIEAVMITDDEGTREIEAKQFVDATGDGNLAYTTHIPFIFGDGKGGSYPTTRVMRIDNVPKDQKFPPSQLKEAILKAKADGYKHLTKESGIVFRVNDDTVYAILPSAIVSDLSAETQTKCEIDTRRQCRDYMEVFHKYVPGMEHCRLVSTGARLGIRDSRHFRTKSIVTVNSVHEAVKAEDTVAMGGWPCEMHKTLTSMLEYVYVRNDDCYGIPYTALQSADIENLSFGGRQIGADHESFASIRVMGTSFATGQAAGVGAAVRAVNEQATITDIQKELIRQNAYLEGITL